MLLRPDLRAHQVFLGFDSCENIYHLFKSLAREDVQIYFDGELRPLTPELQLEGKAGVVKAVSEDNPGGVYGLVWVVDRLLGPGGCPWDQAQTHESLKRHLLEESYELFEAIDQSDDIKMREELGDVLLQPLMHSQMKSLAGGWGIDEVAREITDKLIRRHPHVFGDVNVADAGEVLKNWDAIKQSEKGGAKPESILAGVPKSMPALLRAFEVSKRAARAGFEWPDIAAVWDKYREEENELKEAISAGEKLEIVSELGDLLFTVVNIARWVGVEPEEALQAMVTRFTKRFQHMEEIAGRPLKELSPEQWDDCWNQAKQQASS